MNAFIFFGDEVSRRTGEKLIGLVRSYTGRRCAGKVANQARTRSIGGFFGY